MEKKDIKHLLKDTFADQYEYKILKFDILEVSFEQVPHGFVGSLFLLSLWEQYNILFAGNGIPSMLLGTGIPIKFVVVGIPTMLMGT